MADAFLPPSTPPPPQVPEGWKAVWNEQYHEWFYVNLHTKASQWEKPTAPAEPIHPDGHGAPQGPPPSYDTSTSTAAQQQQPAQKNTYDTTTDNYQANTITEDQQQRSGTGKRHGLLGKLLSAATKHASSSSQRPSYYPYPGQQSSPYMQQGYNNSFPPHRYTVDPYHARYGGGYYPPPRRHGGLGAGGGAALGLGGGLLGGAMLGSALSGPGYGYGGGYGGGYGSGSGSDAGGSDYGGGDDFGGGDFGGGDFGGF